MKFGAVPEICERRGMKTGVQGCRCTECRRRFTPAVTTSGLVVLDDVGLGQVPSHGDAPTAAHMLWSLIDLRHQRTTTAITSNIKLSEWGKYLGDTTVTAAVLDRLAMTSVRLDIDGPSYRQHLANLRAAEKAAAQ